MRIIITNHGNTIIKELNDEHQNENKRINKKRFFSSYRVNKNKRNILSGKYQGNNSIILQKRNKLGSACIHYRRDINNNLPFLRNKDEENGLIKHKLRSAKHIKLVKNDIVLPPDFLGKYENNLDLLPSLKDKEIIKSSSVNDIKKYEKNKFLSFKEIIPSKIIMEIKKDLIKELNMKNKLSKITNNDFRSEYKEISDIQKFNYLLSSPKFNSERVSLIKYLRKKKLNIISLKSIFESNDFRINRINKICKVILKNNEKEKIGSSLNKDVLNQQVNFSKRDFQKKFKFVENEIISIKQKLEKYNRKNVVSEKIKEKHRDLILNYWYKHNYDRLNKKGTPSSKYPILFEDFYDFSTFELGSKKNQKNKKNK